MNTGTFDGVASAEFSDLFSAVDGGHLSERLPAVLGGARPSHPVVDLGAGTGLCTMVAADHLLGTAVYAVERSRAMRAVLHSRIASRADLRNRVTVVPGDLFTVDLPARWGVALAIHLVCQLPAAQRRDLWRLLGARLSGDAFAVVDRHYGPVGERPVADRLSSSVVIGDHTYERWYSSVPISADTVLVRTRYRVLRAGELIDEQRVERMAWTVSEGEVIGEASRAGLTCTPFDETFMRLRRR
jgi:hypothetical protein